MSEGLPACRDEVGEMRCEGQMNSAQSQLILQGAVSGVIYTVELGPPPPYITFNLMVCTTRNN